jgi:hypothetical protein
MSPRFDTNCSLGISNSDEDFHFVLLARREIYGPIGDIAGFETHDFASIRHPQTLTRPVPAAPMGSTQRVREFSFLMPVSSFNDKPTQLS